MSGYLERLVQTAARPAQSVHPFAGSVFSAPHPDMSHGFASENSAAFASTSEAPAVTKPPHIDVPVADPSRPSSRASEYRAITGSRAAVPLPSSEDGGHAPVWEEPFVQSLRSTQDLEAIASEPNHEAARQPAFHPLLPQVAVETESLAHGTLHPEVRVPKNQHPAATARANDDIQIHIGRIEVTAVAPPAPRTNKPVERGPNLGAYLNRRAR